MHLKIDFTKIVFIRELYYQNVATINNQILVNDAIDNISCLLEVGPWELGVFSTSKGLVYGNLKVFFTSDEVTNCNVPGGTLIPQDLNKIVKVTSTAYFILVVEKDSIFQKLLDEDLPNKLTRPFIMITVSVVAFNQSKPEFICLKVNYVKLLRLG